MKLAYIPAAALGLGIALGGAAGAQSSVPTAIPYPTMTTAPLNRSSKKAAPTPAPLTSPSPAASASPGASPLPGAAGSPLPSPAASASGRR